jgi:branched-chain amino acid transport system permease protein
VILSLLNHFVTAHTKYYGLVLGLIILSYALVLRKGILDILLERLREGRRRRAAPGSA